MVHSKLCFDYKKHIKELIQFNPTQNESAVDSGLLAVVKWSTVDS